MTYQDPDLRDHELRSARVRDRDYRSNAMWGWIAGAVVLVLMLVFLFGGTTENTNTAGMNSSSPSANAPTVNPPPANNIANAPRPTPPASAPAETTGQSSSPNPAPSPQQ